MRYNGKRTGTCNLLTDPKFIAHIAMPSNIVGIRVSDSSKVHVQENVS